MQILSLPCYFNISFPSFHMNSATLLLPTVRGMWERGGGGNKIVIFIRSAGTSMEIWTPFFSIARIPLHPAVLPLVHSCQAGNPRLRNTHTHTQKGDIQRVGN